ncbi:MAG: hypothetical protein IPM79_06100 [Polyangiaceae bacterium]|nr:hypothetical protein [Polyangiaceae bacterium]MBK8937210.1 hypothetical protein [Polyangiaceae bacterium]
MPTPIRFHCDFLSPYASLAWTQVHALADGYGRGVAPIPSSFAALLDANGNQGASEGG